MAPKANALALPAVLTDLDSPVCTKRVCQASAPGEAFKSPTKPVIRLCFLSLCPVGILDSTEETLARLGARLPLGLVPSFRVSLGLSQLHCGKKVRPASNTNDLDTKSIENPLYVSFDLINGFPSAAGSWASNSHTPTGVLYFSKGPEALFQEPSPPLSAAEGLEWRERERRGSILREISFPHPTILELGEWVPLCPLR